MKARWRVIKRSEILPRHDRGFNTAPALTRELAATGPVQEEEEQDGSSAQRRRVGSNRSLPLPPVMDAKYQASRNRWLAPKAKPDPNNFTDFQRRFKENPFAHALATPIRHSNPIDEYLPTFFCAVMELKDHPKTKAPWLIPTALSRQAAKAKTTNKSIPIHIASKHPAHICLRKAMFDVAARRSSFIDWLSARVAAHRSVGERSRIVCREDMADVIHRLLVQIAAQRLRPVLNHNYNRPENPKATVILPNGPTDAAAHDEVACILYLQPPGWSAALEQARTQLETIQAAIQKEQKFLEKAVKVRDARRVQRAKEASKGKTKAADDAAALDPAPEKAHLKIQVDTAGTYITPSLTPQLHPLMQYPPLDFPTADYRGRKVPVYHLCALFGGAERIKEMVKGTRFEHARCVAVRGGPDTLNFQLWMWRLQGYMAETRP